MLTSNEILKLIEDEQGCFGRFFDEDCRECGELCPIKNDCKNVYEKNVVKKKSEGEKFVFKKPGMVSKNRIRAESAPDLMEKLSKIASNNGWNVRITASEFVCQKSNLKICLNKKKIFAYVHNDELFTEEEFAKSCIERISKVEARQRHIGKTRAVIKGSMDAYYLLKNKLEDN